MASTSVSRTVPATPEKVWNLIGGFDALPDWLPYIPESVASQGGRVRQLKNLEGEVIVERLVDFNETERQYSYAILQAPFPVDGYVSTIRVHTVPGRDDLAEVQWSGRFNPVNATDQEVVDLFTGIYADGLDALDKTLAG
ncbi:SRPBCC family protein [Kitasatospora sp. NPDC057965]|uniref:SRPBCC family protein n=1 Tax=Kitasatospora sp. NPDC057965 TaxID=3346291 RepID=UPI0036DD9900